MKTKQRTPSIDIDDEIAKYKWIESEKVGFDIGTDRATSEWLYKHFKAWHKHSWNRVIAEALKSH